MNPQRFRFSTWPGITVALILVYVLLGGTERIHSIQAQKLPPGLPDAMTQIGGDNPPTPGRLFVGTTVSGGLIYAGLMDRTVSNPELFLLSTSDLVNLPLNSNYQAPQLIDIPNNLVVQGLYLYIAENQAGLRIYRINYPYRVTTPLMKRAMSYDVSFVL
jgi:hypothetical protein